MKNIIYSSVISIFVFGSHWANALECEVTYKAKKVVTKKYLMREIKNPEYKAGKTNGRGSTLSSCEKNALQPLKDDGWTIKYSKATITSK